MELSIIVPVYNVEKYLKRCVDSVLQQDYHDYEIILVDDGSTDSSGKICNSFCSQHPSSVRVIHKENGGLSSARNAGLNIATGDYIMFLDSDDWIESGCLKKFVPLFAKNFDLIMGRAWSIDDKGHKKSKLPYRVLPGLYNEYTYVSKCLHDEMDISFCAPFYLYRKGYIEKNHLRFYEGIIHEDELWTPLALLKAKNIYVSDIYFYYHYIRKSSIMHSSKKEYSASSTLQVCKLLNEEFNKHTGDEVKWLRNRLAMLFLRAMPQLDRPSSYVQSFQRRFPLKNAKTPRQRFKSMMYFISPVLYCKAIGKLRGY